MTTCVKKNCKRIGAAVIGISFVVGCTPCTPFSYNARFSCGPGTIKKYKEKFCKLGIH